MIFFSFIPFFFFFFFFFFRGRSCFPLSLGFRGSPEVGEKGTTRDGSTTPSSPYDMAIEIACRSDSCSRDSDAPAAPAAQNKRQSICGDHVVFFFFVEDLFRRRIGLPPRQVAGRAAGSGSGRVPGAKKRSESRTLGHRRRGRTFQCFVRVIIDWRKEHTQPALSTLSLHLSLLPPLTQSPRPRSPPRPSGASQSASGRPVPSATAAAAAVKKKKTPLLPQLRAGRRSSAPRPAPCHLPLLRLPPPLLRPCSGPLLSRSRRGSTRRASSSRGRSWRKKAWAAAEAALLLPLPLRAASLASAEEPRGS